MDKEEFYLQEKIFIDSIKENLVSFSIYKLKTTGQIICEIDYDIGLDGTQIEIDQITDVHINYCLPEDFDDEEIVNTYNHRKWLSSGESVKSLEKAMDIADYSDQTIITGDILD